MMDSANRCLTAMLVCSIWLLSGCSSPSTADSEASVSVDRIEVYYRDFDTLAPIRYSTEQLIRSATLKTVVTDRRLINSIHKATALSCIVDATVSKDQLDMYLLVREYNNEELTRTWTASRFHFLEWPGNSTHPCKLKLSDREELEQLLEGG